MLPILLLLFACITDPTPVTPPEARPVVVAELFTSQGCSSCPPADRLLSELIDEAAEVEVLALSFHVDYWNYLGWVDPFSDAAHSERQRHYAAQLGDRVYTPQLILNGRSSHVGSRTGEVRRAVAEQARKATTATIALAQPVIDGAALTVTFQVAGAGRRDRLAVALVERHLDVKVRRGENGGRTLHHDNVVRAFTTADPAAGTVRLPIPEGLIPNNAAVIAYVQAPDWQVCGAATVNLAP